MKLTSIYFQDFKLFPDFKLDLEIDTTTVTGKTSVLWSLIFYLRTYNLKIVKKTYFFDNYGVIYGNSYFRDPCDFYQALMRQDSFTLIGTFDNDQKISFTYFMKNGLVINQPKDCLFAEINFAFMQPYYQWGNYTQEQIGDANLLTSGMQHLRVRLKELGNKYLEYIEQRLNDLSPSDLEVKLSQHESYAVLVEYKKYSSEIGVSSLALQKIVAIYVLLFTLAQRPGQKIFMIDEPKALVSDADYFLMVLKQDCLQNDIQLIMTL